MVNRISLIAVVMFIVVLSSVACTNQATPSSGTLVAITPTMPQTTTPSITSAPVTTSTLAPATTPPAQIPNFSHVFIIVMENREANSVVGNTSAKYLNSLAAQYASASTYYGVAHPSLPNYLALTGGNTFGVSSDCTNCFVASDSIVSQLEAAGRSWKAYEESMPSPCFVGDEPPLYRQKHDPLIYYNNVRTDPARCNKIVPFTQLEADLQANTVPDYVWITPNMCNDMHDCTIEQGDAWLQTWVPKILASPAWQNNGVLFITFDEGTSNAGCCTYAHGGRVATLVISPLARPGFTSDVAYNHYSLLRTIEQAWGLPFLGHAGCDCTTSMTDVFKSPPDSTTP